MDKVDAGMGTQSLRLLTKWDLICFELLEITHFYPILDLKILSSIFPISYEMKKQGK